MAIDWKMIATLEGARILTGYVPDPGASKSGVTIATGFDLGQRADADLMDLPNALRVRLHDYLHLRGPKAVEMLRAHPLEITPAEADLLDAKAQAETETMLRALLPGFDQMPDAVQTVAASVSLQYGSLRTECPKFFALLQGRDWRGMAEELDDFGDAYTMRRHKERDYLKARL
jgi:hypothetical protein